jgi:cytochrome P450
MTERQPAAVPAHIALRRRYGAWNAGRETPPAALFFEPERGRWVIAGYEEALAVFEQRGSDPNVEEMRCPFAAAGEATLSEARTLLRKNLFFQMSPNLERLRRILMQQIGPRATTQFEPALMFYAHDLLARALAPGLAAIEVAGTIARPFVNGCLFDLVGVPEHHRQVMADLADGARGVFELATTDTEARTSYLAFAGLCRRIERQLFESDGLPTALAKGVLDAVRAEIWTREEAIAQVAVLVIAARTTPMAAMTSLIYQLATHPDVWAAARSGALSPDAIIEESLRLGPPAAVVPKVIIQDTTFDGVTLPAGERVLLLVGRANRDPAVFADPDRFDPWRPRRRNLAFGAGRHKCPGHALAHLQLRSVLAAFLAAFPKLELAARPEWGELLHGERPISRLMVRSPQAGVPS